MYKTNFEIKPVVLYKEDLYNLEELLRNHTTIENNRDFKIRVEFSNRDIEGHSFDELFKENNLPEWNTYLTIEVMKFQRSHISLETAQNIDIRLNKHSVSVFIRGNNEVWVNGIERTIYKYFKQRRPWYTFLHLNINWFMILVSVSIWFVSNVYILVPLLIILLSLIILSVLIAANKLLPSVKINYYNRLDKVGGFKYSDKWGKIGFIATIIGIVVSIVLRIF